MEEKLNSIFINTNDWLKFAEAKNGIIITLNGAGIFGLINLIGDEPVGLIQYKLLIILLLFSMIVSLIIALLSFFPNLKISHLYSKKISVNDNLVYYGHICKYPTEKYVIALYSNFENRNISYAECPKYEKQLAEQIVINSRIAMKKYYLFDLSVGILVISIVFVTIGSIIIA